MHRNTNIGSCDKQSLVATIKALEALDARINRIAIAGHGWYYGSEPIEAIAREALRHIEWLQRELAQAEAKLYPFEYVSKEELEAEIAKHNKA